MTAPITPFDVCSSYRGFPSLALPYPEPTETYKQYAKRMRSAGHPLRWCGDSLFSFLLRELCDEDCVSRSDSLARLRAVLSDLLALDFNLMEARSEDAQTQVVPR